MKELQGFYLVLYEHRISEVVLLAQKGCSLKNCSVVKMPVQRKVSIWRGS